MFVRLSKVEEIDSFSMKNNSEMWLHYMPYSRHPKNAIFQVPLSAGGRSWPQADRLNISAFAAYVKLIGCDIYLSIEFSAQDADKARALVKNVGYEEKNSRGSLMRLLTKRFSASEEAGMAGAVKEALDEFCKVGEKVVAALDGMQA